MSYNAIIFTEITDSIVSDVPLGAFKCAHVLRKNGYSCLVVNHFGVFTLEEMHKLIDRTVDSSTLMVGFSTTFLKNRNVARDAAQKLVFTELAPDTIFPQGKDFENSVLNHLKNKNHSIKTFAGGTRVHPDYSNKNIDYVCLGFSEVSVVNLADHLSKNVELDKSHKNIWGVTIVDDRMASSYDFQNEDMVWELADVLNHKTMPIELSRGCIFKCKFCAFPMNGKQTLDFVKSQKNLKYELEKNYYEYGIEYYTMADDTFNDHESKLTAILDTVSSLKFQPKFWGYNRLDLICTRPETLDMLYNIGVRAMYFGIETMHLPTGRIIGKGFSRDKQIEMIHHIRKTYPDISLHGSFIVGLPEESRESVEHTLAQLASQEIPLHSWMIQGLTIRKSSIATYMSEIEKDYEKFGYTDLGSDELSYINWGNPYFTRNEAHALADEFMMASRQSDYLHISGQTAMNIASTGHKDFSFDQVRNTLWKNMDWGTLESKVMPAFIDEYKQQLFKIL